MKLYIYPMIYLIILYNQNDRGWIMKILRKTIAEKKTYKLIINASQEAAYIHIYLKQVKRSLGK